MQVTVNLLVDRGYGSRETVTGVLTPEAASEVDVLSAVHVPDVSAHCAIDDELRSGNPGGDVTLARSQDAVGRAALSERHSPSLQPCALSFLSRFGRIRAVMLAAVSASSTAIFISLVAGVAGSVQVAVSGAFGRRIGVLEATAFGSLGAAIIVCSLVLVARQGFGGVLAGVREPPWLWLNAVMGAIVVLSITFAAPRIGTFATIGLLIAGQLAMGVLIDAIGLFGLERIPLNAARLTGLLLLAGGALLVLKR
jgi:transporter family-2 protein